MLIHFVLKLLETLSHIGKGQTKEQRSEKSSSFVNLLCAEPLVILLKIMSCGDALAIESVVLVWHAFAWPTLSHLASSTLKLVLRDMAHKAFWQD